MPLIDSPPSSNENFQLTLSNIHYKSKILFKHHIFSLFKIYLPYYNNLIYKSNIHFPSPPKKCNFIFSHIQCNIITTKIKEIVENNSISCYQRNRIYTMNYIYIPVYQTLGAEHQVVMINIYYREEAKTYHQSTNTNIHPINSALRCTPCIFSHL